MYLVVRRGGVTSIALGGELAGAAAVACVRAFAELPELAAWRPRPGKVCLRARGGQSDAVLESEPYVLAGDAVACLPPRRRSQRGPLLERMQAMTTELEPAPPALEPVADRVTYVLNPRLEMSSGKTLAQIAHAAVIATDTGALEDWVAAGCPASVVAPSAATFDALCDADGLAARVIDAGLTEVPPGTVTALALHPSG
jgi:peptidyl-tRNA hydrolase